MKGNTNRTPVLRQVCRAAGIAATVTAGFLLYRQQLVRGFLLAFIGLTVVGLAETALDYQQKLTSRSLGTWMGRRSHISTLGQMCNIASWFCLTAALISWIALH
jgi:hypothetical protein